LNIVFDLGGVVFAWEPEKVIARVSTDPQVRLSIRREIFEHGDWLELDRGTLEREEALRRAAVRTGLPEKRVAEILDRVPESLVAIPETVDLLHRLKARGNPLFCLSNMHVASIRHLEEKYSFWHLFEGRVISSRIHLIKPEPEIYRYLLDEFALIADETVFIDDTSVNLEAAERFGLHTIRFEGPESCERRLTAMGCL